MWVCMGSQSHCYDNGMNLHSLSLCICQMEDMEPASEGYWEHQDQHGGTADPLSML